MTKPYEKPWSSFQGNGKRRPGKEIVKQQKDWQRSLHTFEQVQESPVEPCHNRLIDFMGELCHSNCGYVTVIAPAYIPGQRTPNLLSHLDCDSRAISTRVLITERTVLLLPYLFFWCWAVSALRLKVKWVFCHFVGSPARWDPHCFIRKEFHRQTA